MRPSGSAKTVMASAKETPCLLRLSRALPASHSNVEAIAGSYESVAHPPNAIGVYLRRTITMRPASVASQPQSAATCAVRYNSPLGGSPQQQSKNDRCQTLCIEQCPAPLHHHLMKPGGEGSGLDWRTGLPQHCP